MEIVSLQNTKIKKVIKLRERRQREKSQLFLIEGYRELLRAVENNRKVEELFICPEYFLGSNEQALIDKVESLGGVIVPCSKSVFKKISYRDRPDGLLAVAPQKHLSLNELDASCLDKKEPPFFLIAESIEKPGNLGTILRSADASGVQGVIICDRCTDLHNPNVVRASTGTLFTVPVVEATGEEVLEWLKKKNMTFLAATPSAKKVYTEVDLTGPVAIAVGTEQLGLSKKWMEQATLQVKIPMQGNADSLNVATATTLLLYEVLRQRGIK